MQRTTAALARLPRHLSQRQPRRISTPTAATSAFSFSTSTFRGTTAPFGSGPSPPRLPKEEQEIFERLQRQSTGAFSTPRDDASETTSSPSSFDIRSRINQSPDTAPSSAQAQAATQSNDENGSGVAAEEDQFHPNLRRGAPPEFEGNVNPKTGEVGGPKNEPLRWGSHGDYSYNGRVTDF